MIDKLHNYSSTIPRSLGHSRKHTPRDQGRAPGRSIPLSQYTSRNIQKSKPLLALWKTHTLYVGTASLRGSRMLEQREEFFLLLCEDSNVFKKLGWTRIVFSRVWCGRRLRVLIDWLIDWGVGYLGGEYLMQWGKGVKMYTSITLFPSIKISAFFKNPSSAPLQSVSPCSLFRVRRKKRPICFSLFNTFPPRPSPHYILSWMPRNRRRGSMQYSTAPRDVWSTSTLDR